MPRAQHAKVEHLEGRLTKSGVAFDAPPLPAVDGEPAARPDWGEAMLGAIRAHQEEHGSFKNAHKCAHNDAMLSLVNADVAAWEVSGLDRLSPCDEL